MQSNLPEDSNFPNKTKAEPSQQSWFMFCICVISFCVVFSPGILSFSSAYVIYSFELLILILYLVILREFPPFIDLFKQNRLVGVVLLFWLFSISISLIFSPYNLVKSFYAIGRYVQTVAHIISFLFLWDFLTRYQPSLKILFRAISLSTICVVFVFIAKWLIESPIFGESILSQLWGSNPPLNTHIRHTGYQAVAALAFSLVFFIDNVISRYQKVIDFILFSVLWGFLFWLGGRGAVLSILVTVVMVYAVLRLKKMDTKTFIISTLLAIIIGLVSSEWLSIGGWSGMFNAFNRSLDAESLNQLSTNRLKLYLSAWYSVKDHLLFGLGPQGYSFMPNHIFGTHPHNVIIQFIVEWGVSGAVLFLILLIMGFWAGFKRNILGTPMSVNKYKLAAGAVITALSVHALFDGTYYHPQPSFYLVIAFAIWIASSNAESAKKD